MRVFIAGARGAIGRPLIRQLVARRHAVVGMTRTSNAKARRELGWQPRYTSWREGFRAELG